MDRWKGATVVVVGLARSGVAVAKCLHRLGAHVIANDIVKACPEAEALRQRGITVICGEHPENLITENTTLVIKNPGIPYHISPIQKALECNIPVVTEVEVAGMLSKAPIIGITGTNGKTTTTALVGEMLAAGGLNPVIAGNIGTALTEVVQEVKPDQWLVAELSSFQLKGTKQFHPHVAALLNVEEAHLDYHQTFEDYFQSKQRIFLNQTDGDFAILNADSPACREISHSVQSRIVWFSRLREQDCGVYVKEGIIYSRLDGKEKPVLSTEKIALCGVFNLENALAATAIALACGCPLVGIVAGLTSFTGVEHRLEYVATVEGARYYNDSKATNLKAAKMALESFEEPIIWVAGGLDRGIDFVSLVSVMKQRVKAVIAYGETKGIFRDRAKDAGIECSLVQDVKEAVQVARSLAGSGDVVLLSPACASWDMYTSFEERGSIFKQAVHSL